MSWKHRVKQSLIVVRKFTLWTLFFGSLGFFLLAASCFLDTVQELEFGLSPDNSFNSAKDLVAAKTMSKLVRYAEANHIAVHQFRGPYFKTLKEGQSPRYGACFDHPTHFFCYDDLQGRVFAGKQNAQANNWSEWIKAQPH